MPRAPFSRGFTLFERGCRGSPNTERGRTAPISPSREGLSAVGVAGHNEEYVGEAVDGFESVRVIVVEASGHHAALCAAHHRAREIQERSQLALARHHKLIRDLCTRPPAFERFIDPPHVLGTDDVLLLGHRHVAHNPIQESLKFEQRFLDLPVISLSAGQSNGSARLVYVAEESFAYVVLRQPPCPEQRRPIVTPAGRNRGVALAHGHLPAPEPKTTPTQLSGTSCCTSPASSRLCSCEITGCSDTLTCGRTRKLISPTLEPALHFAAQPCWLLALIDGDVGPSHHLPLRYSVAERDLLGKPNGESPQGHRVFGRHEAAVHGVAALPVQTLPGGEVPLGRRHHVGPEPGGSSGRFAPQGRMGHADAKFEADQVEWTVERRVVP